MRAFKILTVLLCLGAVGILYRWAESVRRFPDSRSTLKVLDRAGALLAEEQNPQFGRRDWRPLSSFSPFLLQAVLEQEDRRFLSHFGIDPKAILRALITNLKSLSFSQGGSTITQQTAKILLENGRGGRVPRTLFWKAAEAILALDLEFHETKAAILERYLNSVYLGHRMYGVQAASEAYFGKSAKDLSQDESSFIADRIRRPNMSREVLPRSRFTPLAPHFASLIPPTTLERNDRKGDRIISTTLQADIQQMALDSVRRELKALRVFDPALQAAVVVIDIPSGELRALIGSADFDDALRGGQVNHAIALRQPGSTLKPFTYFLSFLHHWNPSHLLIDAPYHFYLAEEESYTPRNFDRRFHGVMPVREALANSYNVPAVLTLEEMGTAAYLNLLHQFGFASLGEGPSFYGLALTLGSGSIRLTELTNAYAALGRGGEVKPLKILDEEPNFNSTVSHMPSPEEERAAFYITNILSDPEARRRAFGDAELMNLDRQPVAVKTGTSHDSRDAWAVGYTPRFAVGVWTGHTDNSPMPGLTGAEAAIPIWHAIMNRLHEGVLPIAFKIPSGVVPKAFCRDDNCDVVKADWDGVGGSNDPHLKQPEESLRILRPVDGDHFLIDPRQPAGRQKIYCEARVPSHLGDSAIPQEEGLHWFLDGHEMAENSKEGHKTFLDLTPGRHELKVAFGNEKSRPVRITVSEISKEE